MNDSTTLVIAAYDMPETNMLEKQGVEFEKLTGVCVTVVRLSAEEMEKKVLEEFEKRAGTHDIVDVSAAAIPAFAPYLEPLDDRILQNEDQIRVEDWPSRIFSMYARYRGQTLTLPWRGNAYLLYYRKDIFEGENLEPPTNLNKLLRAAKRLHRPDKDFYGFASAQHNGLHICLDWLPVLWGFGGEIYSETISALLNSEAALKALEYYIKRNNYAAPGILDFGYYEPFRLMQEGRVAMMQQWSMAAANLENPAESKVSGKVGYLPAPGYPVIGGGGLGVNKYGAHKEAAWEFLKWFTSPEVEKKRVTIGGSPTRSSTFRSPELLARYPYIAAIEQALMVGRQRPRHEEWNRIQDIIGEAVWSASAGTKSPTEALASANARVQEILEWSKELSLLDTVSSLVSQSLNVEEILNNVLEKAIEIERADAGAACLLDETTGKPSLAFHWGGTSGLVEKVAPGKIDEELVRHVVQSEEPYVELHPTGRELFKKEHSEAIGAGELQSFVGFRIGTENRPIGIVIIAFRRPRRFSYRETNLLTVIGQQVGQAIENARLYETVQQELAARKRVEEELRKANRALKVLSECNQTVVRATEESRLLHEICRIIVEVGEYRLAWVGFAEQDEANTVRPVAQAGFEDGYLETMNITWADTERPRARTPRSSGPTGTAIRTGKPTIARNIQTDSHYAHWSAEATRRGYASSIALPLIAEGRTLGALNIYAVEPDAFDAEEVKLLMELADDLAFGIVTLRTRAERKRAEEELRKYHEHLEELVEERTAELAVAMKRAEEADRLKSAFLATMSHELRTPLNSIIGFTGIMLMGIVGELTEEQRKQLIMVKNSANHLLNLINDVLDISKIEAGQVEIVTETFDMHEAIEKVVRTVTPLVEEKGLTLVAELSPEVGEITSDQRQVEQILLNLLNNAVKFTEKGEVRIECQLSDDYLVTRVVDTGIGIKPEDMDKLFEAFQQIDSGLTRRHEGTGLGLSICKKLLEMLGGEIRVESEWGVGSTFTVKLPIGGEEEK